MADPTLAEVVSDPDKLDAILIAKLLAQVNKGDSRAAGEASKIGERMAARKAGRDAAARIHSLTDPLQICREIGRLGEGAAAAEAIIGRDLSPKERREIARGAQDRLLEVRSAELSAALAGGKVERWMQK